VVDSIKFSFYFEGYGLYEDADFSTESYNLENVINTKVQLHHYHDAAGDRINTFMAKWWYAMVGMYGELKILNLR
jgi:hypothetical protein